MVTLSGWAIKSFLTGSVIICSITKSSNQTAWTQIADFPGDPRSSCSSFSFDDFACVGLGYDGVEFRRSFYAYYPSLNSWSQIESMGGISGDGLDRNVAASFTLGNKGYVGTGQGGAAYLKDFWEYNSVDDSWTQKADFGGSARRSALGFADDEFGYIGLGQDAAGFKKDLWQYDTLANAWMQKANFPGTARRLAVAFTIAGIAYAGSGDDGVFRKDFYAYNSANNSWNAISDFAGSPRYSAVAFSVNERGYVGLGYDSTLQNVADFWRYNPLTDSWVSISGFPGARSNATSFSVGSIAYVGTGYDTVFHSDFWSNAVATTIEFETRPSALIFPNPVFDQACIVIPGDIYSSNPSINILSLSGEDLTGKVCLHDIQSNEGGHCIRFQKGKLGSGMYLLVVRTDKLYFAEKLVVL